MTRIPMSLMVILVLVAGCGGPGTPQYPGGGADTGGSAGGNGQVAGAPAGFGSATLTYYGNSTWPFNNAGTEGGTIMAQDDMGARSVLLMPGDGPRFIVSAATWPLTEGPADFTVPCGYDSHFDACAFHFTEMKVGQQGTYWSTWYFHGTLSASKEGAPVLTATF